MSPIPNCPYPGQRSHLGNLIKQIPLHPALWYFHLWPSSALPHCTVVTTLTLTGSYCHVNTLRVPQNPVQRFLHPYRGIPIPSLHPIILPPAPGFAHSLLDA